MNLTDYGFVLAGHWQLCGIVKSGVRFVLTQHQTERVIYAFVVDGDPMYIGICENDKTTLRKRMDRYQSRCGSGTNGRIAENVLKRLLKGQILEIHAFKPEAIHPFGDIQVDLVKGLENPLIAKFKPLWNGGATSRENDCVPDA